MIDDKLRELTGELALATDQDGQVGLLGGENGYGCDYENDVFMMHRFCWCEQESCRWCEADAPNFWFKATDFKLTWYKYIGRGMEYEGELPDDWYKQCTDSLWGEDGCYFKVLEVPENDIAGIPVEFCFHRGDGAIVKTELSPFARDSFMYWGLDTLIGDVANNVMDESPEYHKLIELDKKYPKLKEWVRQRAIKRHEEKIIWHKRWLEEELTPTNKSKEVER